MKCSCENGKVFAFINRGEDYQTHTQEFITCGRCGGTGKISICLIKSERKGRRLRNLRRRFDLSMMKVSKHMDIKACDYSAFEHGRKDLPMSIRKFKKLFLNIKLKDPDWPRPERKEK